MLSNEIISDMFTRFTKVTTALYSLGKLFTESENVRKIDQNTLWVYFKNKFGSF